MGGLRYRLHPNGLSGKPDIAFGPSKLAVFVDGCYWHNCPDHGTILKIIENGGLKNLKQIGEGIFKRSRT